MTKTTNQRRTSGSILEGIQQRLAHEQIMLEQAQADVLMVKTRITTLESVLMDAEKNGEAE